MAGGGWRVITTSVTNLVQDMVARGSLVGGAVVTVTTAVEILSLRERLWRARLKVRLNVAL